MLCWKVNMRGLFSTSFQTFALYNEVYVVTVCCDWYRHWQPTFTSERRISICAPSLHLNLQVAATQEGSCKAVPKVSKGT